MLVVPAPPAPPVPFPPPPDPPNGELFDGVSVPAPPPAKYLTLETGPGVP